MSLIRSVILDFDTYSGLFAEFLRQTATQNRQRNLIGASVLLFGYFFVPGIVLLPILLIAGSAVSESPLILRYGGTVGGFLVGYGYVRATGIEGKFASYDTDLVELVVVVPATVSFVSVLRLWTNEPYNGLSVELLSSLEPGAPFTLVALSLLLLVKPVVQELFFRGVMLTHLDCSLGPVGAILSSAGIYAAYLTFTQAPSNILENTELFAVLAVQGLMFGYVYQRTEDLLLVATAHVLIDLVIVVCVLHGVY